MPKAYDVRPYLAQDEYRRLVDAIDAQYRAEVRGARFFALMFPLGDVFGAVARGSGAKRWFRPLLPLPGVLEQGPFAADGGQAQPGAQRAVRWSDGSTTQEELLALEAPLSSLFTLGGFARGYTQSAASFYRSVYVVAQADQIPKWRCRGGCRGFASLRKCCNPPLADHDRIEQTQHESRYPDRRKGGPPAMIGCHDTADRHPQHLRRSQA